MVTPRAVTLVVNGGWRQDGRVVGCVTTAATTQRAVTARTVRKASSETPANQKLPLTPAKVRPFKFFFSNHNSVWMNASREFQLRGEPLIF